MNYRIDSCRLNNRWEFVLFEKTIEIFLCIINSQIDFEKCYKKFFRIRGAILMTQEETNVCAALKTFNDSIEGGSRDLKTLIGNLEVKLGQIGIEDENFKLLLNNIKK